MNDLQIFNYDQKEVRMVSINGEPWWVAKDVCDILDIQNTSQALNSLEEDERSMLNIGRQGEANIVNESGLYSLIFKSNKTEAKKFKKWITSEVLPAIRKTGKYELQIQDANNMVIVEKIESLALMLAKVEEIVKKTAKSITRMNLEEIMSFFNIIDYNEQKESIVVEYSNRLFLINRENYFTVKKIKKALKNLRAF